MNILYGVVGEGMGHAMRSSVVLEHLVAEGHRIEIVASGRAVDFLSARFGGVTPIHGFHIIYQDNRVRRGKTLWSNVLEGAAGVPHNIAAYFELIEDFAPEAVVSDFESWSYLYAKAHHLPVLSIDNMQIINRCDHDDEILQGYRSDFELTRAFIKGKLPFCQHYFITTFFHPPIRKERTSLHAPILRPAIVAATPREGEHLLIYQTAEGHETLLAALERSGIECRIYGMRRGIEQEQVEGKLRFRPFSEQGFVDDLASCRGVIAGGGFTLMGEAVHLRKPMLAVPVGRQFEQVLNARYLQQLGYGRHAASLDDAATIDGFIEDIDACREALEDYQPTDCSALFTALDHQLDKAAAGLA